MTKPAKEDDHGKKDGHGKEGGHEGESKTFPEMVGTALMYLVVLAIGLWASAPILEFIAGAFESMRIALNHALSQGLGLSQKILQIIALIVMSAIVGGLLIKLISWVFQRIFGKKAH